MSAAVTSEETLTVPVIPRLLNYDDIVEITGKSRATIDRLVKNDPDFPKPVRFGTFSASFYEHEVSFYLHNLKRAADAPVHHEGKVHLHKKRRTMQRARRTA